MNTSFIKFSTLAIIVSMSMAALPGYSEGKNKTKGKTDVEAKEKRGREAGELPYGLEQFSEKKGTLPSGLQKQKDEGTLTRGLEDGGKPVKSTRKASKGRKM